MKNINIVIKKDNFYVKGDLLNNNSVDISILTSLLLDKSHYYEVIDHLDKYGQPDYSQLNDIEMIYLFVHNEKDLNDEKNRKENTKREYLRDLLIFYKQLLELATAIELQIEEPFNYRLFKKLTNRHLRKYQEWLKQAPLGKGGKTYSVATLNRKMIIIKGFFSFLFEVKYLEYPLHKNMKSSNVRAEDRPVKELTSTEVSLILKEFKNHPILYGVLSVLATTGIRVNELCTARVCDLYHIDEDYWLTVVGKGNKKREVLIHQPVFEAIQGFRLRRRLSNKIDPGDTSPLFVTAAGNAYSYKYLSNYITTNINKLNLDFIKIRSTPVTPHFFRHAWAIYSDENGASLTQIQEGLDHKDIRTTQIYLKRKHARKNNASRTWKNSALLMDMYRE